MAKVESHYDVIEQLIDDSNLNEVIKRIARICHEKADHLRENWQDENLAKLWERNGRILGTVEARLHRTF